MASPKQQAAKAATEVAQGVGREGIGALEREAQRRRENPCAEVRRLEHKLSRLPRWRWLARAVTRNQLGRARDLCAASKE